MQVFPEKFQFKHIVGLSVLAIVIGCLLIFDANERTFHALDALGICAGLWGVLLVLHQISSLKTSTEAAALAATKAQESMTIFLRATELSRVMKLIDEVKQYNREKKTAEALLRLNDVRTDIIFLSTHEKLSEMIGKKKLSEFLQDLSILIGGIDKDVQQKTEIVDYVDANARLDRLLIALTTLDSKIKQQETPSWT